LLLLLSPDGSIGQFVAELLVDVRWPENFFLQRSGLLLGSELEFSITGSGLLLDSITLLHLFSLINNKHILTRQSSVVNLLFKGI